MVVQDMVKHYGRKYAKSSCLIKLDLQKAYGIVDQFFLHEMLFTHLGFLTEFMVMIMEGVITPRFSMMINGSMKGYFKSTRGLRLGNPMSTLLFVICM